MNESFARWHGSRKPSLRPRPPQEGTLAGPIAPPPNGGAAGTRTRHTPLHSYSILLHSPFTLFFFFLGALIFSRRFLLLFRRIVLVSPPRALLFPRSFLHMQPSLPPSSHATPWGVVSRLPHPASTPPHPSSSRNHLSVCPRRRTRTHPVTVPRLPPARLRSLFSYPLPSRIAPDVVARSAAQHKLHDPREPMRRGRKAQPGTQGQGGDACTYLCVVDAKLSRVTTKCRYRHANLASPPAFTPKSFMLSSESRTQPGHCSPTHATLGRVLLTRRHHYPALPRINQD